MPDRPDREREPRRTTGETAGEAAGGLSGLTAGAALGSLAGPLGTMIGAVAGAVGGWWAVHAVTAARTRLTPEQEAAFRERHERRAADAHPIAFEQARAAYQIGFIAGCNPRYAEGGFAAAEPELRLGWSENLERDLGPWPTYREIMREGFECARQAPPPPLETESRPGSGIEPLHQDPAAEAANRVHDRLAERRRPTEDR